MSEEMNELSETIRNTYPIHLLVWFNKFDELRDKLAAGVQPGDLEKKDCRGRTPLMLAVTLGQLELSNLLMEYGALVNTENNESWTVVQEAVSTGDVELLRAVVECRDYQRYSSRVGGVPELLQKLKEAPDFYVEMKWEFTSWVPLVSRMCPSDTYKVYKQGSNVRIDTTLLGFDQNNWHRGNTSFIFQGQTNTVPRPLRCNRSYMFSLNNDSGEQAKIMEVDHETKQVFVEEMRVLSAADMRLLTPYSRSITARLTAPITTTFLDTDKISFERNKSGIWGWRQDKTETVNDYMCKVFGASNVELVTKTRHEHLSEEDKIKYRSTKTPLQSFLGIAEHEERTPTPSEEYSQSGNPCHISAAEYFNPEVDLGNKDIGRPKETTTKIQKFKATLWLSEEYPLSLPEQIMPIVDLMAISSSHFAKLKNFIQMQLPSGFPVKIEIPLFHVLNARITFGNIFGSEEAVSGVQHFEENGRMFCTVDEACFEPPASYVVVGAESRRQVSLEEEDDMLDYAIQKSLLQSGTGEDQVDIWEALNAQRPITPSFLNEDDEDKQLQRRPPSSPRYLLAPYKY
ncbi:Ankyrin repeat domain-containing protein [Nesidiocoris tenuis]|uniref:Ankyrin repeat domain-containing protein n=1 Tax=Nesidiocoris tenuis TaxID=355587 RepID=A0ABN7B006_9HEMI|nr:Ankyrin repeat domain-containing protein [Nesidiocoris tenuis]